MTRYHAWLLAMLTAVAVSLAAPSAQAQTQEDAILLVQPFGELLNSATGMQVLDDNRTTIFSIQNNATRAEQIQAIRDFTIDGERGSTVADGLGAGFRSAYFNAISSGAPSVVTGGSIYQFMSEGIGAASQFIGVVKDTYGKNTDHLLPAGAEFDVYGRAYLPGATDHDRDEAAHALNHELNPRPFQIAEVDPAFHVVEFSGHTFIAPQPGAPAQNGPVATNTQLNATVDNSASFLSGHTTYAYSASILFAMMVPERYQEMMLRASDFGNSRVVMGAHYPLDVIGGRTLATYMLANWLAQSGNQALLSNATTEMQQLLMAGTGSSSFNDAVAAQGSWTQAELDANRALFAYRMTYGLPNLATTGSDAPENAHYLLLTRFPYMNEEQRTEVIRTTMLPDAGPLANTRAEYENWTRVNLFDAAGGYGSLDSDTSITMDASKGGLHAYDTWNNDIGGTGFLTKHGTGSLELSGESTFAGVDVLGGSILLSGAAAFTDTTTVGGDGQAAGLFLGPSLSAPGVVVFAQGTLGRVGDYGATQLTGDLSFATDSAMLIRFGGAQEPTDSFDVDGTTTIQSGALFQMINPQGNVPTTTGEYTVLTSTTALTGQFDDAILPDTFATTFALMTDTNRIYITVTNNPIAGAADTPSQLAIAKYVDAVINAGSSPSTEDATNGIRNLVTRAEVQAALDQLSPQVLSDAQISTLYASLGFANALLSCKVNGPGTASIIREGQCLWAGSAASFLDRSSTSNQPGYTATTGSFAAGAQIALDDNWRLGFGAGYQTDQLATATNSQSNGSVGQAGVALKYNVGSLLLAGVVSGGGGSYETKRTQAFGGFFGVAQSDTKIGVLNGGLRIAYVFGSPQLYMKPVLDAGVTHIRLGDTTESGSSGSLAVAASDQNLVTIAPSVEMGTEWWLANGLLVRPFLRTGATFYEGGDLALDAAFVGAPPGLTSFVITSEMDDVMGLIGAGLDLITAQDTVLHVTYDGQFGETTQIHSVGLKGSARF